MNVADWVVAALVLAFGLVGAQAGLAAGAIILGAFVGGAALGARIAPQLLDGGAESPYAPLAAVAGGVMLGMIAAYVLYGMAARLRTWIVRTRPLGALDSLGGVALFAALGLALAWAFSVAALHAPQTEQELRRTLQRSVILSAISDVVPPSGPLLNVLRRIGQTPQLDGPDAGVGAPDPALRGSPGVAAAADSVVRVVGTACGLGVTGSGWVAGPQTVVTNAHVVAGQDDTRIITRDGSSELSAQVFHFEPRNDVAVLRVEGLGAPALGLAAAEEGTPGVTLGFPAGGAFTASPARVGAPGTVLAPDAYGRGPFERSILPFRGRVVGGNSGGPVVDRTGQVLTTVFASSVRARPREGLGIPNRIVGRALERATGPVSSGPCAT